MATTSGFRVTQPSATPCPRCGRVHGQRPATTTPPSAPTVATTAKPETRLFLDDVAKAMGAVSLVLEPAPDPYATAKAQAPRVAQAEDDPNYTPFGNPPNGYAIALAARRKEQK